MRKQVEIGRTTTGDLNKSAVVATFQKKSEKSCMMYDLFLSSYAVEECKQMIRTVQIFISKGTVVKNSPKQKTIWIKNCMI